MAKFVTVAYLFLLIGQAVCDLECYKCWDCKEKTENWDKCTEDSIPESTTTTITSTITPTTTITPPSPTTTSITTVPSHSSETSAESSTNSETTTNILGSTTIKTTTLTNEKLFDRTRTTTSLPVIKVILGKSEKVETKQHKCAFIKYQDDNDNDIIDRFCTMEENCENIGKTSYADKKIICNVCETNLCNKDEPGSGRTIHSGTLATVFFVAISKMLLFN